MFTDIRAAWCTVCAGPRRTDALGCLECRCADCGKLTTVMLAVVRSGREMRLCSPCWKWSER